MINGGVTCDTFLPAFSTIFFVLSCFHLFVLPIFPFFLYSFSLSCIFALIVQCMIFSFVLDTFLISFLLLLSVYPNV